MKTHVKHFCPPILWEFLRRLRFGKKLNTSLRFHYGFDSWENATKFIGGSYSDEHIVHRVRDAALRVKSGESRYERDGVLFDHVEQNWQLLTFFFMYICDSRPSVISVLDFGGGLGTTYVQLGEFQSLSKYPKKWVVVEQPKFAEVGNLEFENSELSFVSEIENHNLDGRFVALAIGVLQYLQNPWNQVQEIVLQKPEFIFVDATPFSRDDKPSISVQVVPSSIYSASYAAHVFSWEKFCAMFEDSYLLLTEWECVHQPDPANVYKGAIFQSKS